MFIYLLTRRGHVVKMEGTVSFSVSFPFFAIISYLCSANVGNIYELIQMMSEDFAKVRPKKFLGQHFLTDLSVASQIADTVDACPDIPVLEVGPGMGVLTQYLLQKERAVKVVEIDRESIPYLHSHFPKLGENIIEADFLKMDLTEAFQGNKFVLTGNYPYNISSQIFFKMLDNKEIIPCCTGMIQKEVAERLAANPGNKAYGVLSVLVQAWYDVEYLFTVNENVFNPPPKVKSAVICMKRNNKSELGCDEKLFRRIVKTVFTMRRKMIRNGMKQIVGKDCPMLEEEIFNRRPEQLSVDEFIELTNRTERVLQESSHSNTYKK